MGTALPNLCTDAIAPPQCVLGGLALIVGMSWDITLKYTTDAPANVNFFLPEVHWIFYALPTSIFFLAFVVGLKRLVGALRRRRQAAND